MTSKFLLATVLLSGACADFERGPAPPVPDAGSDATSDGGKVPFAAARAVLLERCARCHAAGQTAGQSALVLGGGEASDLAAVRPLVNVDNPAQSRLLAKATGQGHEGGTVFRADSPEYAALLSWIQSGAGP